ncbi:mixed-linked glucanase [Colletotrichum tofieldiae]|nr:mixed-linked glucanase [Colletotrichum tofieldiae]
MNCRLDRRYGSKAHAAKRATPANVLLTLFEAIVGQPGSTAPVSPVFLRLGLLSQHFGCRPDGGNLVGPVPTHVISPFTSVLTIDGAIITVEGSVTLPGIVPTPGVTNGPADIVTITVLEPLKAGQHAPEAAPPSVPGGEHDSNEAGGFKFLGFRIPGFQLGPGERSWTLWHRWQRWPRCRDGPWSRQAGPTYFDAPSPGPSNPEHGSAPEEPNAAGTPAITIQPPTLAGSGPPENKPTQSRPGTVAVAGSGGWKDNIAATFPVTVTVALTVHFLFF